MGTERGDPEPACREQFQAAVSVIQSLPRTGSYRPSYEEMLRFYSYYKQATLGPCLAPRPGFWDPIGRYKWDAWHSLGRMSKEEAMSAYVAEIKLVAQKVIDTVPLGEVAEDAFAHFAPLYQVIPNMPRPPEAFLRRITGWKEQELCRDDGAIPGPAYLSTEPAPPGPGQWVGRRARPRLGAEEMSGCHAVPSVPPAPEGDPGAQWSSAPPASAQPHTPSSRPLSPVTTSHSPESQTPRDLDLDIFCDSLEQLEPELVRAPCLPRPSPEAAPVPLPRLVTQVWAEQRGAAGRDPKTKTSLESPEEKEELGGGPQGSPELDMWLVGTVRALQESMRDVQGRLRSLESKPRPPAQQGLRPWPLRLSAPTLLFFLLWPFVVQWLLRQLRTHKR